MLLGGLILSLAMGAGAAPLPACTPDTSLGTQAAPWSDPKPVPTPYEEAAPPATAEGALPETLGVLSADPVSHPVTTRRGGWRPAPCTPAPRGPVLDGPLRPPRVQA
jgi:hypothetical protein